MPFQAVPFRDRLLNRLVKKAEIVELARGERVFAVGAEATDVVLVREGLLLLEDGPDDASRTVDVVLPWEVAGAEAVLRDGTYRWSAVAARPSAVQRLDGRGVRSVLKRAEGTLDAFLDASFERLQLTREMGPGGRGTTARRRLALLLLHLAHRAGEREGEPSRGPLELPLDVTHRVLGQLAGLHRSTVTTALNDWIYEGLLEDAEEGWRIPDPDALLGAG